MKFRFTREYSSTGCPATIGAVVVDHDAGPLLESCVRSLLADGAGPVVVVENGAAGSAPQALIEASGGRAVAARARGAARP